MDVSELSAARADLSTRAIRRVASVALNARLSGVVAPGESKRERNGTLGKNKNTMNPRRIAGIAQRTAVVIESENARMTCERIGSSSARITVGRPCRASTSGTAASASGPT